MRFSLLTLAAVIVPFTLAASSQTVATQPTTLPAATQPLTHPATRPAETQPGRASLVGLWQVIEMIQRSRVMRGQETADYQLRLTQDRFQQISAGRTEDNFEYTTRPDLRPREIDVRFGEEWMRGIYRVRGDRLELAFTQPEVNRRPADFTAKDENAVVFKLKRVDESGAETQPSVVD